MFVQVMSEVINIICLTILVGVLVQKNIVLNFVLCLFAKKTISALFWARKKTLVNWVSILLKAKKIKMIYLEKVLWFTVAIERVWL